MLKSFSIILLSFFIWNPGAFAQFTQTDDFNFGEDQTSHAYDGSGVSLYPSPYACDSDNAIHIGYCFFGSVSIDLSVEPNCDSILLVTKVAYGGESALSVDGIWIADLNLTFTCAYDSILITNASSYSADGIINVLIADNINSCSGDVHLSHLTVYSSDVVSTTIKSVVNSNYVKIFSDFASGQFVLTAPSEIYMNEIIIYNLDGQLVRKFQPDVFSPSYSFTFYESSGIYFLTLITDSGTYKLRFFVP